MMDVEFDTIPEMADSIRSNSLEVCEEILKSITEAYNNSNQKAEVFKAYIKTTNIVFVVDIDKDDWVDSLTQCLDIFETYEESDLAIDTYLLRKEIKQEE